MFEFFLTSVVFLFSLLLLNRRIRILSTRPSVLGFTIIITVLVQIIPGIILVSLFDYPMSYGVHDSISASTRIFTLWYTLGSLAILFFSLWVVTLFVDLDVDFSKALANKQIAYVVFLLALLVIFIKVASVGDIPLLTALRGDGELAALQKARILRGDVGAGGFVIGYLFVYFPYVALVYLFLARSQKKVERWLFLAYLVLIAFYSLYDLQKYKFGFLVLMLMLLRIYFYGMNTWRIFLASVLIIISLFLSFYLLGDLPLDEILNAIASRLFIGQMEGSYMIYESLVPDFSRLLYGMPMAFLFGDRSVMDPAAEVIGIFFPDAGEAWVNSNTYVLAHAWSIFGLSAIFIMPLIVAGNVMAFAFLRNVFSKFIGGLSLSIYFVLIMTLQLNNDFSFFLYFKSIVAFCVLGVFSVALISFARVFKNRLRRQQ